MARLSVRLTDDEERLLARLRDALEMLGWIKATFVRHLIREKSFKSFTTASEVLVDAA
jgi:hypothetical protein